MWWAIGVAGGLVVVALSLLRLAKRPRQREIDAGSVSASWLAEHRGRTSDT
ncbi:MAG: hypothetical protein Q8T13_19190 [Acidobacteriota bacterium]|nr:hypothetical protein [Acidobacteriota bacterium]